MIKLRTMRTDAETGSGPVAAAREDPRVTPIGRWLRRHEPRRAAATGQRAQG